MLYKKRTNKDNYIHDKLYSTNCLEKNDRFGQVKNK